jgi:competence protein ComGC
MQSVVMDVAQMLINGPKEGFAPSEVSVAVPPGIQLLSISVLLLVFAVATTSKEGSEEESQTDTDKTDETPNKVQLVRPDVIAFRAALVTGVIGLLSVLPSSPRKGFIPEATDLESLEGLQFLSVSILLLVFALAVHSEDKSEDEEKSKVQLTRIDAIAFRSALTAGLVGVAKAFGSSGARAVLVSLVRQDFLPSTSVLEVSEGIQWLSVSLLVLVFALAVCEDSEQKEEKESKIELVRTEAIAFRLSGFAALVGSLKTFGGLWSVFAHVLPASPPAGFNPAVVSIEVSEAIQFLTVSVLLLVFAVAVLSDDEDKTESTKSSQVELLRVDATAFRFAIAAGFLGLIKALPSSPPEGFAPAAVSFEAPEGIHFLCISTLFLVFAVAVKTDEVASGEKGQVQLVTAGAIAFRAAAVTGLIGILKTFANADARAELATLNQTEFVPEVAMVEAPEGVQLLIVAALLFVFAAAVSSEDISSDKADSQEKVEQWQVEQRQAQMLELVRPQTIAFRMAVVAGLIGFLMTIDNGIITLPRMAATGEIALVLGTGIAVMLTDIPRQLVSV